MTRTLCWFRDDLRVADHPALHAACEAAGDGGDVIGLYVLDDTSPGVRPLGGAARWWLHGALESLEERLAALGIPLLVRRGDPQEIVAGIASAVSADRVQWTRRYGGPERNIDAEIKASLPETGIQVESFPGHLLHEPWTVETTTGGPYKVFTPFWRALAARDVGQPLPEPGPVADLPSVTASLAGAGVALGDLSEWELRPSAPDWAGGLQARWDPTESAGQQRLATFIESYLQEYDVARDHPADQGTSGLSPYLRFGQVSPRDVMHSVAESAEHDGPAESFISELGWREFCWHLLYHFPQMPWENLRSVFDHYPWSSRAQQPELFEAWASGRTGFPWVDAGQRELWETGHMHNRVRMASASLLVKNFGIDWREGEAWFWDTLVDADAASNPANWQWVAGSGADAAPYFRIFNPDRQLQRFDPDGEYVSRWVPERDTEDYPEPIIDLKESRQEALAHYEQLKKQ